MNVRLYFGDSEASSVSNGDAADILSAILRTRLEVLASIRINIAPAGGSAGKPIYSAQIRTTAHREFHVQSSPRAHVAGIQEIGHKIAEELRFSADSRPNLADPAVATEALAAST